MVKVTFAALAASSLAIATFAQAQVAGEMAFVACPIVQDTPTVPCWLAEYGGQTYYMGIQTDVSAEFSPPSLGHKVLVEGTVTDREICGARVIDPIKVSVMPELSPECNELRMAIVGVDLGFESPRAPGPSNGRLAFAGNPTPRPVAQPPFEPQTFVLQYDFDAMVSFRSPRAMTPALRYAQLSDAKKIELRAYRGATQLEDGTLLVESEGIAQRRAEQMATLFRRAGLDDVEYEIVASGGAIEGGPDVRRIEIIVHP